MKKLAFLIPFLLIFQLSKAQPEDKKVGKITFLMVDGKYEDAVSKSEKLKDDPDYRKNGWVYYYLAQSYFEIAGKAELQEEYPKALKESLKAAYKLYKYKDKPEENAAVYETAKDFLTILKDSVITVSEIYYDNDNPKKGAYYLKRILKFDETDYSVLLMKGVYEIKSRNIGEGVKSIKLAMENLTPEYTPDPVSVQTLLDGLDEFALIVKSGEYDKYFAAYKYSPSEKDIQEAMALKENFKKYLPLKKEISKEDRKKESEIIYKTFKSDEGDDDDDDDE